MTEARTCSRAGCIDAALRQHGHARYCARHYRFATMRTRAKRDGKTVPDWAELETLTPADMICPSCSRVMNWLAKDGFSTVITLQHDRDGIHRLICLACNLLNRSQRSVATQPVGKIARRIVRSAPMSVTRSGSSETATTSTNTSEKDGHGAVLTRIDLRDYFAGQALVAFGVSYGDDFGKPNFKEEARRAYECADAMLAAREKASS
jgi:hypothetical protein